MFRAIKKTRISEEVVSQIHRLIRDGKVKAGDQLPSERELAETFKVSRTSVREALRALETQGLIVSRSGMGNFVADLPVESLIAPLARLLIEEKNALADIFELRKLIEPNIAALAAARATANDIQRLTKLLDDQRTQIEQGESGVEADTQFHFAIAKATQNHALEKLVSGLMEVLSHSREESLQSLDRRRASLDSHRAILSAVAAHKEEGARAAMLRHIEEVEKNVFSTRGRATSGAGPRDGAGGWATIDGGHDRSLVK
ncbi:MAG TPA: FadR/GntR family transcriptional regulator [Candidatus Eisenbacteria bacterium]|nr:FadR/GntR family transcriptional regulator [Candidatus Eisenbacteria bacterium]